MLKYTIAIAALLVGAPTAFAQSTHSDKGGSAGMSGSGSGSSSGSAGATSGGASHERSGASSGASEGSSGSDSSASKFAPGQNESGSAKDLAPGQRMKSEGGSARDYAPGQEKKSSDKVDKRSENKSKDLDRNRADRGDKSGDRNAKNDRDLMNDRDLKDRNAKNDRDHDLNDRNAKNDRDLRDRDRGSTGASEGTEGRSEGGRRGSVANVSVEQKTRIRSIFTEHRVEPARDLHVSVNVGTRLPRSIHLYPVPAQVISIVPEYRDYEYILLDDNRVAIIDPDTFEVVDIIILT